MSTPPTILLIHGCFSTPLCFNTFTPHLQSSGYPIATATYPSAGCPPSAAATVSVTSDALHIREQYLLPLIDSGKDVVLVLHSFGGVAGAGAAVGLSKVQRKAEGKAGVVIDLVYIAGNIVHEGQSLLESCGGMWPGWFKKDEPFEGLATLDEVFSTLYSDIKSMEVARGRELVAAKVPQAYRSLTTPAPAPCWLEPGYEGRLAYVRTGQDQMNPPEAQDMWIAGSGREWKMAGMNTGHAPYVSWPSGLAKVVVSFVKSFERLDA